MIFTFLIVIVLSCYKHESQHKKINYPNGVKPIAPYSPGVIYGNMMFISGQIAINPKTSELVINNIENEMHQVMKNLISVLETGGFQLKDLVKVSIFMTDMAYYEAINKVYEEYFKEIEILPAREAVAVKSLPKNVHIEVSGIAIKN